jgi:hypothetical protein
MAAPLPLVKGTLDVLVLKALAWTPMHGFEITTWLEARSGGALGVQDSALTKRCTAWRRAVSPGRRGASPRTTSAPATTSSLAPVRRTWPPRPRRGCAMPRS